MRATQDKPHGSGTRLEREAAYWDSVYGGHGGRDQNLSWMEYVEETTFNARFFRGLLEPLRERRILSIGGGVDRLGVGLAREGHRVMCVDVSPEASARTEALARRAGVIGQLTVQSAGCEELTFAPASFDTVVCKRALHHMEIARVVPILHSVLETGGIFLAEEPVCLHPLVRWVHERFPFYGDAPHTPDEKELTFPDLNLISKTFRSARLFHFDFLARASLAYRLNRRRWNRLLYLLGKTDFYLANHLVPPLSRFCNYVMIYATK
jgi:SAM-dependent methyltransferase